jgi:hypothetical protein
MPFIVLIPAYRPGDQLVDVVAALLDVMHFGSW